MQILVKERLGITLRRVVAWWIDAFLAAAIIIVVRWSVNALFDAPITGRVGAIYDIAALAVVFYLYRVICEAHPDLAWKVVLAARSHHRQTRLVERGPAQRLDSADPDFLNRGPSRRDYRARNPWSLRVDHWSNAFRHGG